MTTGNQGVALLSEVAQVLREHGHMPCSPVLEDCDGRMVLTVTMHASDGGMAMEQLELTVALQRLQSRAQLRSIAKLYDIDAAKLEALLPREEAE